MTPKIKILSLILFFTLKVIIAQSAYFSFYHLKETVPQTQNLQPAFVPESSLNISIPLLNAGINLQTGFNIENLLSKREGINGFTIDFDPLFKDIRQNFSHINQSTNINIFHFGIKFKKAPQSYYAIFINTKSFFNLSLDKDLIKIFAQGITINNPIDTSHLRFRISAHSEIGLGYSKYFLEKKLTLGIRLKIVKGLLYGGSENNIILKINTSIDNFFLSLNNANINSAGQSTFNQNFDLNKIINTNNNGYGIDLGIKYKIKKWLLIETSIIDLGRIEWRNDITNYRIFNISENYTGIEPLINDFQNSNKLDITENQNNFGSPLGANIFANATTLFGPHTAALTIHKSTIFPKITPSLALSYGFNKKWINLNITGTYKDTKTNFGIGSAFNLGFFQLYAAADNVLLLYKPEKRNLFNFRMGINLNFSYKKITI